MNMSLYFEDMGVNKIIIHKLSTSFMFLQVRFTNVNNIKLTKKKKKKRKSIYDICNKK